MSFLMNSLLRNASRALSGVRSVGSVTKTLNRSIWNFSQPANCTLVKSLSSINKITHLGASCGCGACHIHTQGDKELVEFLADEIKSERKRASRIPSDFDGFTIKLDGSEMILTKIFEEESVEIKMNLTHSVDTELHDEPDMKPDEQPELKSKPHFEVKLVKGDKVTRFACSYVAPEPESPDSADVFTIDELAVYEGTLNDQTYAVSGDVLDGYMYDLLMNLLEERGVSNAFVDKLSGLATKREHELYVKLLQKLQDFFKGE